MLISVIWEALSNSRQLENKTAANLVLKAVTAPLLEKVNQVERGWMEMLPLLTYPPTCVSPPFCHLCSLHPTRRITLFAKGKRAVGFYFQIFQL